MDLNEIDNEAADHVIDLIDTLINTPVLVPESGNQDTTEKDHSMFQKNKFNVDYQIADAQNQKIITFQKGNNINLVRNVPESYAPSPIRSETENPLILDDYSKYVKHNKDDLIMPLNKNHQISTDQNKELQNDELLTDSHEKMNDASTEKYNVLTDNYHRRNDVTSEKYHSELVTNGTPSHDQINMEILHTDDGSQFSDQDLIETYGDNVEEKTPKNITPIDTEKEERPVQNNVSSFTRTSLKNDKGKFHSLDNIQKITKELSKNMVLDVKQNLEQTHQYIKNNKYELMIDFINYVIIVIDFLNKIIHDVFLFMQNKILGKQNNFFDTVSKIYNLLIKLIVKKITFQTLDTFSQMEEKNELLDVWKKFKKESNIRKRGKIIKKYLQKHDVMVHSKDVRHIKLPALIELVKNQYDK